MTLLEHAKIELSEVGLTKFDFEVDVGMDGLLKAWAKEEGVALKFDYSKFPFVFVCRR